jgi:hypothetical protein
MNEVSGILLSISLNPGKCSHFSEHNELSKSDPKSPPFDSVLKQFNPIHTHHIYFLNINFNIILPPVSPSHCKLISLYIKGKGKVIPVFLNKHHAMKAYWGVEVQLHSFFDLGTRWR